MFDFLRSKKAPAGEPKKRRSSVFSTDVLHGLGDQRQPPTLDLEQPSVNGVAADSMIDDGVPMFKSGWVGMPEAQASWYIAQMFIGYPMCAQIAKHWLVDKSISMPARDAIRQGYRIDGDGDDLDKLENRARKREMNKTLREFVNTGRRFGGAAALFLVETTDPDYYEKPFNLDGVLAGQYKGIKIIEPQWMTPDLLAGNVQDPASESFYKPTFWYVGNRRYHHSHFCFYTPFPVSDYLKQTYNFFGVSVPERIYERVYAAERTANEAPQLALTKRLLTLNVDNLGQADRDAIRENMAYFSEIRDNYGVQIGDSGDTFQQFDTALGDLDNTIMTQYQLVAAGASVPAVKLLETTPKGFNATGEFEAGSYRESLESIQTNDLEPLLDRHLLLLARHEQLDVSDMVIVWEALDSPTAKEYAEIQLLKAQTAQAWASIGSIDGEDGRKMLSEDRDSDYFGMELADDNNVDIDRWRSDETNEQAGTVGEEQNERQAGGQAAGLPGSGIPSIRTSTRQTD